MPLLAIRGVDFLFIVGGSWALAAYVGWQYFRAAGRETPTPDDLDGEEPGEG